MAKEWAWSYSKLKNFDTCPHRHEQVDLLKNFTEDSEQLTWGNSVHDAMAKAIQGTAPLPATMAPYQKWVDVALSEPGLKLVEQKYAITRDFQKAAYFGPTVWYRGIADLLTINGNYAKARDWKTGKIKHDSCQLMLMASCVFVHYPEIEKIDTEFVWLQEDCTTPDTWERNTCREEWLRLMPRIEHMERAYQAHDFPPRPSGLCRKWCPVKTCQYHGSGA